MTSTAVSPSIRKIDHPYQGLLPFREEDRRVFCGRESHVRDVLQRLAENHHFVSVVGLSGSGKSSLVQAGVIPELRADRLSDTSSDWLVAMSTPGSAPLSRLAKDLTAAVNAYITQKPAMSPADFDEWASSVNILRPVNERFSFVVLSLH